MTTSFPAYLITVTSVWLHICSNQSLTEGCPLKDIHIDLGRLISWYPTFVHACSNLCRLRESSPKRLSVPTFWLCRRPDQV